MPQESSTMEWDPRFIDRAPSTAQRIYALFVLLACVVTLFKLIRVWRFVLPFSAKRPTVPSAYLKMLQASASSLGRWIHLTLLAWGLLASTTVYDACNSLFLEKVTGRNQILLMIQNSSADLSVSLSVVLFLYLARWHLISRMEGLRD